jgi:hypothetical protein
MKKPENVSAEDFKVRGSAPAGGHWSIWIETKIARRKTGPVGVDLRFWAERRNG